VTLLLGMGPFRSLVNELRLTRDDKYALLFTFVQRLAIVGGGFVDGVSEPLDVRLKFGTYLPTDLKSVVEMVIEGLQGGVVSRASALKIVRDAGLDLDEDLAAELERIEHEDFAGAGELATALAAEEPAYEYLGRTAPELPPPVKVETVPPGGAPGAPGGAGPAANGQQQGGAPAPGAGAGPLPTRG
jgi:hypothetical protein